MTHEELDKDAATERFVHDGQTVTVKMIDPAVTSEGNVHPQRPYVCVTPGEVEVPTPGFALYCPATFTVTGLPHVRRFTIGALMGDTVKDIGITSMEVTEEYGDPVTRTALASVPTSFLLRAALNAAAFTVLHFPPGYDGPLYQLNDVGDLVENPDGRDDMSRRVEIPGTNVRTGVDEFFTFPIRHGGMRMPVTFAKAVAGVPQMEADLRLRQIATLVRHFQAAGMKWERFLGQRFNLTERSVRRLVQEARDAGYLDPVPPTDRRARKQDKK
jgi:hypothetical protein